MAAEQKIRVCQWGRFDAADYGDRLFPLIAREQLSERLPNLELTCFAPTGRTTLPVGSPPCFPLASQGGYLPRERRDYFARQFDAVLIGGGDLLRFDRLAPDYDDSAEDGPFLRPYHAFLDPFWGDGEPRPEILWNAPGVPSSFEPSRRPLVRLACSHVDYLAVRDEASRGHLLGAGVEGPVHVVPDTGVLAAGPIRSRVGESRGRELLERQGVDPAGRGLLCFGCEPASASGREDLVARVLLEIAATHDLEVVLLPVESRGGALSSLRLIEQAGGGRLTLIEGVGSPLEIGAIIGGSDYFVGSSLPASLTALSFGVPHVVVNTSRLAEVEGFVQQAALEDFRISDWAELGDASEALFAEQRERWSETGESLKGRVSEHFDRLAELISEASGRRETTGEVASPRRRTEPAPDEGALAEAYGSAAELHDRLEDEVYARRTTAERLNEEIGELRAALQRSGAQESENLEGLRQQLAERELMILDLTRKLRNFDRLRDALEDRTERLAEKEQEVEVLTRKLAVRNHMSARRIRQEQEGERESASRH